jgi:hypothetical protein
LEAKATFTKLIELNEKLIKSDIDVWSKDKDCFLLAQIFSLMGEQEKAVEYFNKVSTYTLEERWCILQMEYDPCFKNIRSNEQFQETLKIAKSNWQKIYEKVRIWLEENNLLKI